MKLISFLRAGQETWGAVLDSAVVDLKEATGIQTLAEFLGSDSFAARDSLVLGATDSLELDSVQLLPPIPRPEKIVCAVRNYLDHHQEMVATGVKRELSEFPPIFLRTWRSQVAHLEPIVRPRVSETLDWEGEMAVVITKGGRDIPEESAYEHVAGYSVYNDATIREWQFHAKQITSGKNFESTGGFGPWLVTRDEIKDGAPLKITTRVNGELVQSGDTDLMIFSVPRLIAYASTIFTLVPGDVIVTGTPSGVGFSRTPPRYLKPGDMVEVEVENIGILRNPVIAQC
jgi:2-keto-4-pentenoate hydratase/2-oxohepta-3-ene-1,7-dioic acid hydratase in catechol pathway